MISLAIGVLLGGQFAGADGVVSACLRAMPAAELCRQLSQLSGGTRLEVLAPLATEVVLLDVKDAPLEEIRERLAYALRGEWTKIGGGFRLVRPAATQKSLEKTDLDRRTELTERLLKEERRRFITDKTPFERAEEVLNQIRSHPEAIKRWIAARGVGPQPAPVTHGDVLLRQLVASLDPRGLAALGDGVKVDWSDRPTPMERPLPSGAATFLEQFKETEVQIAALVDDEGHIGDMGLKDDYLVASYERYSLKPAKLPGGIGKTILSGYRIGRRGYVFRVSVFNTAGQLRAKSGRAFFFDPADARVRAVEPKDPASQRFKGRKATLSALAGEMLVASTHAEWISDYSRMPPYDTVPTPSRELIDVLCAPEKNEPLGLAVSDAVLALGKEARRNLVAVLPDALQRTVQSASLKGEVQLDALLDSAVGLGIVDLEQSGRWLTIRPDEPLSTEANRISRSTLGRYLRGARSAGFESLPGLTRFHWEAGAPARSNAVVQACRTALIESGVGAISTDTLSQNEMLALLGSLGVTAWKKLEAGDPIDVGVLAGRQKGLLYDVAWTDPNRMPDSPLSDASRQRTVARPTGPVPGIPMTMTIEQVPAIIKAERGEQTTMLDTLMDARSLEGIVGSAVHYEGAKTVAAALPDRYYSGSFQWIQVRILFAPGFVLEDSWLCEPKVDRTARPLRYEELPEAFRKDLEERVAAYVKKAGG